MLPTTPGRGPLPLPGSPTPQDGSSCLQAHFYFPVAQPWLLQLPPGSPFPLQSGLPPHDFSVTSPPFPTPAPSRWAASNWPAKILGQIELVRQQHLEDEEKFRKIQLMDQNNFQEKLEGLQVRLG